MDWLSFPSLNALKAFSVLAETGSYTRAGAALNVTHAAIMQQVKSLEEFFDTQLVIRSGRGISLTEEGRLLSLDLEAGFNRISHGIQRLSDSQKSQPLHVTTSPVFAVKWLMPRLAEFQSRHPDLTLLLNPSGKVVDLERDGIDVAIRYRRTQDLAADAAPLIVVDLVIVGTPELVASVDVSGPKDLMHLPWLVELGTTEVTDWFRRHGLTLDRPLMTTEMPGNLIMDAVKLGDGITYTARQWVSDEIRSGVLVELFPEEKAGAFYIHTRAGEKRPAVRAFSAWLRSRA